MALRMPVSPPSAPVSFPGRRDFAHVGRVRNGPDVIVRDLKTGSLEGESQSWEHSGFESRGRGPKPSHAGALVEDGKGRKRSLLWLLEKELAQLMP